MHGDHTKCVVITQNTRHFLHEGLAEGRPFMSLFLFEVFLIVVLAKIGTWLLLLLSQNRVCERVWHPRSQVFFSLEIFWRCFLAIWR